MIYFDNSASSFPKPPEVADAMYQAVEQFGANPGRSGHALAKRAADCVFECRSEISEMFRTPVECVVFTSNATSALNQSIKGLAEPGWHIVTSDMEHNSVMRPILSLAKTEVTYTAARTDLSDDAETVKAFAAAIRPETRLFVINHASNVCGKILPVGDLCSLAREKGIRVIIDAAQTAGAVPIDMSALGADIVCTAGHKNLYGPQGTGLMLLKSPDVRLKTIMEGGTGTGDAFQPDDPPERFESGTLNTPGIAGLLQGVRFVKRLGTNHIGKSKLMLAQYAYDCLCAIKQVRLYTPRPDGGYTGVLIFNIDGVPSPETADMLNSHGICVRSGIHCSPAAHAALNTPKYGAARLSFGIYNSKEQIDHFINALTQIIKEAGLR